VVKKKGAMEEAIRQAERLFGMGTREREKGGKGLQRRFLEMRDTIQKKKRQLRQNSDIIRALREKNEGGGGT